MPSPFPGMNPWLEQEGLWPDFHTKLLTAINERLVRQVRPRYIVLLEQHLYVHEPPPDTPRRLGRADLSLTTAPPRPPTGQGDALLEAPAEVGLPMPDIDRVPFLEIRDRRNRERVTVIELLSPSNKRGQDRRQYLTKREELLASATHFVEIDLLRGGTPMPAEDRPDCAYSVLVSRVENRPRAGLWPIRLPDRLPEIPSPCDHPTQTHASTFRKPSTPSTTPTATTISSTTAPPTRPSPPARRTGQAHSSPTRKLAKHPHISGHIKTTPLHLPP